MALHSIRRWARARAQELHSDAARAGFDAWSTHGEKVNPYAMPADRAEWEHGWQHAAELWRWEEDHVK